MSEYRIQSSSGLRKRSISGQKQPPKSANTSIHLPDFSKNIEKCQGQFCDFKLIRVQNAANRRYPVKRRLLRLAKLKEYNPMYRSELLIPPPEAFLGLATEYRSALSLNSKSEKATKGRKVVYEKKSLLIEPRSRDYLTSHHSLPAEEVAVCFRCFVVYENLRKLLKD